MKKEAAVGTWKLARSYLDAGSKLAQDLKHFEHSMPAYFLFGHAIELAFKSYLISQGTTEANLKQIGHNLEEAMERVHSYDSFDVFLGDEQKEAIRMLNPYYRGKELEYLAVGAKRFPGIHELEGTANALVYGVEPRVNAAVRRHRQTRSV